MIRAFWWSPLRDPGLLLDECRLHSARWARLLVSSGRTLTNFGDAFSRLALEDVTGVKVRWAHPKEAEVVGLGSILELYVSCGGQGASVWGSGLRAADARQVAAHLGDVRAVRGPLSRAALREAGVVADPATGDPGVLVSGMVPRRTVERRGTGYVPHFGAWSTRAGRESMRVMASLGVEVIAPTLAPLALAEQMQRRTLILTSSLHAMIFSHSLGIPVQRVSLPGHQEPAFKYQDYLQSVRVEAPSLDLSSITSQDDLRRIWNSSSDRVPAALHGSAALIPGLVASARGLA